MGVELELEYTPSGYGTAQVQIGSKNYRLTYKDCFEKEDGSLHSTLSVIEEIKESHPWRHSAVVH